VGVDRHQAKLLRHATIIPYPADDLAPQLVPVSQSQRASSSVPGAPPPGRYGEQRPARRPLAVAALAVLAVVFLGWVVWAALRASAPEVSGEVRSFDVRGPHRVRVELTVSSPDPGRVTCRVQALDRTRGVVGVTSARVRVGESGRAGTAVTVRTRDTAVTAVVDGCSAAGSE
jgi:hypothetical protein